MDITDTLAPRSDQLNADDLVASPRTVTVAEVRPGSQEQPVEIVTQEFGPKRPYKPGKSMRRVIAKAWSTEASSWVGKRMTLYCDPTITFGKEAVGGIRISHMSGLDKPLKMPLTVTRGKRSQFVVEPLVEKAAPNLAERIEKAVTAFEGAGITVEQLETRIGSERSKWSNEDVANLGGLFQQLQRGELTTADFAPAPEADEITGEVIDGEATNA